MDKISLDLSRFKVIPKLDRKRELTNEIYEYFGKQLKWIIIYKQIERKGFQFVLNEFEEVKKNECREPHKLFLWKLGKMKVDLSPDALVDSK